MDDSFDPERPISFGVEQPGVYDGILYWVDINGYAFHRFTHEGLKARAQPFIDTYNAGRTYQDQLDQTHKELGCAQCSQPHS